MHREIAGAAGSRIEMKEIALNKIAVPSIVPRYARKFKRRIELSIPRRLSEEISYVFFKYRCNTCASECNVRNAKNVCQVISK